MNNTLFHIHRRMWTRVPNIGQASGGYPEHRGSVEAQEIILV